MRKIKNLVTVLLSVAIVSGCIAKTNDPSVIVDIGFIPEIQCLYSQSVTNDLQSRLNQWRLSNPDIDVVQRQRIRNEDYTALLALGADHLPDVFITDSLTGRLLSEAGFVMEVGDYADKTGEFIYGDGVYAFPVLNRSHSVVIYDPASWSSEDPVGYVDDGGYSIATDYLSSYIADAGMEDWLESMIEGNMTSSFTDPEFTNLLKTLRERLSCDNPYSSLDLLVTAFVQGRQDAVILHGNSVYYLLECVKQDNPELYNRLEFTTLCEGYMPEGYPYGVFVNGDLEGGELEQCIDLATLLSGSYRGETDAVLERLESSIESSTKVRIVTLYFVNHFWSFANSECFANLTDGDRTCEEYAAALQDYYEQYYLETENTIQNG